MDAFGRLANHASRFSRKSRVAEATPGDIYPNVPASSGNRGDLVTYADYTGAVPGTGSPYSSWGDWSVNAPRSWSAQAEWQAFVQAGVLR